MPGKRRRRETGTKQFVEVNEVGEGDGSSGLIPATMVPLQVGVLDESGVNDDSGGAVSVVVSSAPSMPLPFASLPPAPLSLVPQIITSPEVSATLPTLSQIMGMVPVSSSGQSVVPPSLVPITMQLDPSIGPVNLIQIGHAVILSGEPASPQTVGHVMVQLGNPLNLVTMIPTVQGGISGLVVLPMFQGQAVATEGSSAHFSLVPQDLPSMTQADHPPVTTQRGGSVNANSGTEGSVLTLPQILGCMDVLGRGGLGGHHDESGGDGGQGSV